MNCCFIVSGDEQGQVRKRNHCTILGHVKGQIATAIKVHATPGLRS